MLFLPKKCGSRKGVGDISVSRYNKYPTKPEANTFPAHFAQLLSLNQLIKRTYNTRRYAIIELHNEYI